MTRLTLKAMLVLALAVPVVVGVPVVHAKPPASEEYVFEGPDAGAGQGGSAASAEDSDGSDAAVPILIGVLIVTAAAGAVIAIVRRQRT